MTNSEYWKVRFGQLEAAQNRKGAEVYAEIERQYRQAQKEIEAKIDAWYRRFADNNGVSMAEARRMLTARELAELKWDVNDYIKHGEENAVNQKWMKELENASARFHISRLEALELQTQQSLEVMFGNQLDGIDAAMKEIYLDGYYHTAYELQKGFGVGWDIAGLDQRQIEKVISKPWAVDGKNFSERIWGNKEKLISEVHNELTQNIMLGQDPQKAIDNIARKMGTSKSNAGRLVMTEEAYFSSAAQRDCFNDLDVEQYEIVATLDSNTSDICQSLDGQVFPMKDFEPGVTAPPFHVLCRSITVPYFEDDFDLPGERAARDEEGKTYYVPADMTYQEWKEKFVDGGNKSDLQEVSVNGKIKADDHDKAVAIKDATNFEELEKSLSDTYNISLDASVKSLDFQSVKQSLSGIEDIFSECPELADTISEVGVTTNGVMSCIANRITFNPEYYGQGKISLQDLCNKLSDDGYWVRNSTIGSIGAHEAGHGVEWLIIQANPGYVGDFERQMAWNKCKEAENIVKEAVQNIKETPYGKGKSESELFSTISAYANSDSNRYSETMAEAFADVFANGEKANPLSLEIKKVALKKLETYQEVR